MDIDPARQIVRGVHFNQDGIAADLGACQRDDRAHDLHTLF